MKADIAHIAQYTVTLDYAHDDIEINIPRYERTLKLPGFGIA